MTGVQTCALPISNANPNEVEFPVPGNDDAIRAIQFYCDLVSDAETVDAEEKAAPKKRASRKKAEPAAE